jgi:cytochrome c-type biogenesis protein CcmH/NrfG
MQSATTHFEDALRVHPQFLESAIMLAEAYAQQGRFAEAAAVAQKALDLARADRQDALAEQIAERLKRFRQGLSGATK